MNVVQSKWIPPRRGGASRRRPFRAEQRLGCGSPTWASACFRRPFGAKAKTKAARLTATRPGRFLSGRVGRGFKAHPAKSILALNGLEQLAHLHAQRQADPVQRLDRRRVLTQLDLRQVAER